jgi:hypothetical protein
LTAQDSQRQPETGGVERDGYAIPMTVFSLLRPGGRYFQSIVYAAGRRANPTGVAGLGVIHFARLTMIRKFPDHGQPRDYLRQPLQVFESNYNGSFGSYIDLFVELIPTKMRLFWGTSYGFPCRLPLGPFKRYIRANQFPIDHYFDRYPDASVEIIKAALEIVQANTELREDGRDLDPDEFAHRFRMLVTHLQGEL